MPEEQTVETPTVETQIVEHFNDSGVVSERELEQLNDSLSYKEQPPELEKALEKTPEGSEGLTEPKENEGEGSENSNDDQETTAKPGDATGEEKASVNNWSEEQKKYFTDKGYKEEEIPAFNPGNERLLKMHQDSESQLTKVNKTNGVNTQTLSFFADAIQKGDLNAISQLSEQAFGKKLNFDTRTEEDVYNENLNTWNSIVGAVKPMNDGLLGKINELRQSPDHQFTASEVAQYLESIQGELVGGLDGFKNSTVVAKKTAMEQAKLVQDQVKSVLGYTPKKESLHDTYSRNAESFRAGAIEKDPNNQAAFDALGKLLGNDSPVSRFINLAQGLGSSPEMSEAMLKLGHALRIQELQESGELEKSLFEKFEKERAGRIGDSVVNGGGNLSPNEQDAKAQEVIDKLYADSPDLRRLKQSLK